MNSFSRPSVSRNVIFGAVCAIVQMTANLLAYPVYLHFLGYGKYGVWLTIASIFNVVQFIGGALSPSLTQAVAHSASSGNDGEARQFMFWCSAGATLFGCVLLVLWLAAITLLPRFNLDRSVIDAVIVFGPWLTLLAAVGLATECMLAMVAGFGKFHYVYAATALGQVLSLVSSAALLSMGGGVAALLAGYAVSRAVALSLAGPAVFVRVQPFHGFFRPSVAVLRSLLGASSVMLSGALFNTFLVPFNRWFIAASSGVASVPVFDIGYTGGMQVRNVLEFGLRSLIPEAAALAAEPGAGSAGRVRRLHTIWFRRTLYASLALYGAVMLAAPLALAVWLRGRLAPSQVGVFRLFLLASFFNVLGVPAYYLLVGLKRLGSVFWSSVIQAGLNVGIVLGALWMRVPDSVMACGIAMTAAILGSTGFLVSRITRVSDKSTVDADGAERLWTHV